MAIKEMFRQNKFLLLAILSIVVAGLIVMAVSYQFRLLLSPQEQTVIGGLIKRYLGQLFAAGIVLMFASVMALDHLLKTYITPVKQLTEELTLVTYVNPAHQITVKGSKDIKRLSEIINETTHKLKTATDAIDFKISQAKIETEEEKNRLAAVISGLPEGVVVCNLEGQILLYNKKARRLLVNNGPEEAGSTYSPGFLGLGRSIFGVLDKAIVVHALDEMNNRLSRGDENTGYRFTHLNQADYLLSIQTIPILTGQKKIHGFVLVLYDITQQIKTTKQREIFFESLALAIRSSISSIRAAIETIIEYPVIKPDELAPFRKVILEESISLSRQIERPEARNFMHLKAEWPMDNIRCLELLHAIKKTAEKKLQVNVSLQQNDPELWTRVDSFSMVHAMLFLIDRLSKTLGVDQFICSVERDKSSLILDLAWQGDSLQLETLRQWESERVKIGEQQMPLSLKETVKQHNTEIWPQTTDDSLPCLRMILPSAPSLKTNNDWSNSISIESRPEFYDFDIFKQTGLRVEQENRPLTDLTFTVFDTETTGLNPKEDEIISIGALRIVNSHLLRAESFDCLVDPQRPLPRESIKYHGIQPAMLKGQPAIKQILPLFHNFVEDTVLIGHNVAFDMRMLQMKETTTGIKFTNPVLDTLLLSAVVHPAQKEHTLEEIAKRLGVRVIGRHTALGDAIVTGELFLKLIPLLAKNGIYTLSQATEASQTTYYARLKY